MIRLVNNFFAPLFEEATIATTGGSEVEINNYVGPVSAFMKLLTSKDGNFSSCFDKINEDNINNTTLIKTSFDNNRIRTSKGKVFGQLAL